MISTCLKQTISRALQPFPPTLTRRMSAGTAASRTDTTSRLAELRKLMAAHNVEVYIVPSEDAHQSEYIAPVDARRAFISGFTGSAGCALVTPTKASLSTDGRYFLQAEQELDSNWELLKQGLPDVPTWQEWALREAEGGKNIGVDACLISAAQAKSLAEKLKNRNGGELIGMDVNLVDLVCGEKQPERPKEHLRILGLEFAGKPFEEKLVEIRKEIEKNKGSGLIVSMLDEIAWLFNLRGNDIPYNPVFFSYAFITPTEATLYIDEDKITEKVRENLGDNVNIKPYNAIFDDVKTFGEATASNDQKLLVTSSASWALTKSVGENKISTIKAPIEAAKAVKNETEVKGMRNAHIRDGAAQIQYFAWLERALLRGEIYDEVSAADKLEEFRKEKEHFVGLSFPTISSAGSNGAIIHYQPEKSTCARVEKDKIYLCDSGAQFLDGTTDSTRTVHYGTPTPEEKKSYTLVLKGHIAVARAVFPKGSSGFILDILARQYLWRAGLDYRHGTGHGVGSFLNVHEGPIGIGTRMQYNEVPLEVGMLISNEPGYYEDGQYGIRIENVVLVVEKNTPSNFGDKKYYGFETVTMVPMCKKLTDPTMLDEEEKKWLNEYHSEVYEKTKSFFKGDEYTLEWLKRETTPI
ncbi:peptidase M24, structural domain-containing protein [Lipomyces chichibuensis]|uniref:peptidase M24, structural domain-containing protein n=1 Tax=Lipomyces chichibuensis TaxID=1546026 RepID=UPI003343A45D